MTAIDIISELKTLGDEQVAQKSQRFFKTSEGEYGEGDLFIGVSVLTLRKLLSLHAQLPQSEILMLLKSPYHEIRLFSLLLMVYQYEKGDEPRQQLMVDFYLKHTRYINNWDLVDSSAYKILGKHLLEKDRDVLYQLSKSSNMWERRISIISTLAFIKQDQFKDTLRLAKVLLNDKEDLMHKAVGWMLREVGNRDLQTEESFLLQYYQHMPRTILRYAIEKFPKERRQKYLKGLL